MIYYSLICEDASDTAIELDIIGKSDKEQQEACYLKIGRKINLIRNMCT